MNKICESCRKTTHKTHEVSEDLFQYMLFEKNGKLNEMKAMKTKQILQINNLIRSLLDVKNILQQEIIDISEIMHNNEELLRKMKDFIIVDNNKSLKVMKTYQNKQTIDTHSKCIISIKEISNNRFLLSSTDNKITIWDAINNKNIGELLLTGYEQNENGYITAQNSINQAFKALDVQAQEYNNNITAINDVNNGILAQAKSYADGIKTAILGEGIKDTFDTLVEIQDWIENKGVDTDKLAEEIAKIPTVPTDISAFNNDVGYLTEHQSLKTLEDKITELENRIAQLENPTTT